MQPTSRPAASGFTLVELAIVMIIIGLLIGGVLKGQQLIENAKTTSLISQFKSYQAALGSFKDTYSNLPGDMGTAQARLAGCTGDNFCSNGNGDGIIGRTTSNWSHDNQTGTAAPQIETTLFWKHLALADLITGVTINGDPGAPAWGSTHPAASIGGGFHVLYSIETGQEAVNGLALVLRRPITGDPHPSSGIAPMSPLRAAQIDRKLDDGNGRTGSIKSDTNSATCTTTTGVYYEDRQQKTCLMIFQVDG